MKKRNFGTKAEMASAIYQKRSHTNKHTHTHTHGMIEWNLFDK
jgi:hypothetical protein